MAYDFSPLKSHIKETEEWLTRELSAVRTGRANPAILDGVRAEAYGNKSPLRELANISVEDARTIRVVPWDKSLSKAIEKSVADADLGVSVSVDDQGLRVSFPELTTDRRAQLLKLAGEKTEQARVTLRSHRTDAIKALENAEKEGGMGKDDAARFKAEIQKFIDAANESLSEVLKRKEGELAL